MPPSSAGSEVNTRELFLVYSRKNLHACTSTHAYVNTYASFGGHRWTRTLLLFCILLPSNLAWRLLRINKYWFTLFFLKGFTIPLSIWQTFAVSSCLTACPLSSCDSSIFFVSSPLSVLWFGWGWPWPQLQAWTYDLDLTTEIGSGVDTWPGCGQGQSGPGLYLNYLGKRSSLFPADLASGEVWSWSTFHRVESE